MQFFAFVSGLILIGFALALNAGVMLLLSLRVAKGLRSMPPLPRTAAARRRFAWSPR